MTENKLFNASRINRRSIVILLLGFSSGLPIVLIGTTLQAWYTTAGVNLMTIGLLSLVGQPYIYKFLWAPFLDRYVPLPLGRRRSWILLMQLSLFVGLATMAYLNPVQTPWALAAVAFAVACCSASQDTAIDAYRTDLLPPAERGLGAALTTVGYRVALLVAGALALIMADWLGWRVTYLIMAALFLAEAVVTLWAPQPSEELERPTHLWQAAIGPLLEFLKRQHAWLIILFILTYMLCDVFGMALNTPFLLRGIGFSLTDVGAITKIVGLSGALIGSIVGGILLGRLGLYYSLLCFAILQPLANLPFAVLAMVGKNYLLMAVSIFFENFCGSLSSVAMIVFLMGLCDKRYTATQYALFSALISVGRVFVGPAAAALVNQLGWSKYYLTIALTGLPAIFLVIYLQKQFNLFTEDKDHARNKSYNWRPGWRQS